MKPAHHPRLAAFSGADLLACSPLCSLLSPSCTSAGTVEDTAWACKFSMAGEPAAAGCKRKAAGGDLTPCSALAGLTDCLGGGSRAAEIACTTSSPAFRHGAKRFHSGHCAASGPTLKPDWEVASSSQQSDRDLSLLLHPSGEGGSSAPDQAALVSAPAAEADHSGQLLCEEGLEMEDAAAAAERGHLQRNMGAADCSPRSWDDSSKDARCYSASTSDSQASEGSSFLLPANSLSLDYADERTSPDDAAVLEATAMSSTPSPTGNFIYRRIPEESLIGCMAGMYGFTPFTISVGTSYFERLAARDPSLMAAARATPEFTAFVAATPVEACCVPKRPIGANHMHLGPKHWLTAVHLACIYIAAKNVEFVPYKKLLSTMLSHVHNQEVDANVAANLELEVLQALQWRLGPFFRPADTP